MRLAALVACAIGLAAASTAAAEPVEARAGARVAAPPEHVLAVLADFEAWNRVFRAVQTVRSERVGSCSARLEMVARRAGRTLRYTLVATVDRQARRVELQLDPDRTHDVAALNTTWRVRPGGDGGSLVELRVVTESGLPIPRFVERHIAEASARTSIDELVQALGAVVVSDAR